MELNATLPSPGSLLFEGVTVLVHLRYDYLTFVLNVDVLNAATYPITPDLNYCYGGLILV